MELAAEFRYRVEEGVSQKNVQIDPCGNIQRLMGNFSINAGFSKDFSDEDILKIIAPAIVEKLTREQIQYSPPLRFIGDKGQIIQISPR